MPEERVAFSGMDVSVEAFCLNYPDRVQKILDSLNLERPGLEKVKEASAIQDWMGACHALLEYYETANTASWLRIGQVERKGTKDAAGEAILEDLFTFQTATAKAPSLPDGRIDWNFRGPNNDPEWAMALNRHFHLGELLEAYKKTGNPAYISCIDLHICDWILSNPYPNRKANDTVMWRGLEASFRVRNWAPCFFGLQDSDLFSPTARLLILSSLPDHAHYLKNFHAGWNWVTMEMNGLGTAGVCWPEFKDAKMWASYARDTMCREIANQVYPDGAQQELTSTYHKVAIRNFEAFQDLARNAQLDLSSVYRERLERMWNYVAQTMLPDGHGLLNNDSDWTYDRDQILEASKRYGRAEWAFIASGSPEWKGQNGIPSTFFPWAGQLITRSGYTPESQYGFFDVGPMGGHVHHDKLHVSIAAYGRDLLVDGGRFTYVGCQWRNYFVGSESHNVVLVDGKGQGAYQKVATEPISTHYSLQAEFDYAEGTYDAGFKGVEGQAIHKRTLVYVREKYWIVVDQIQTDRPLEIEALWHFHPNCTVDIKPDSLVTIDEGKGNLRLKPISNIHWSLDVVKGATEPIQGWWSKEYNQKQPSSCAVYKARIERTTAFVWLLLPANGVVPDPVVEFMPAPEGVVRVGVTLPNSPRDEIAVSLSGEETIPLSNGQILKGVQVVVIQGEKMAFYGGGVLDKEESPNETASP